MAQQEWTLWHGEDGNPYWHNHTTGESIWAENDHHLLNPQDENHIQYGIEEVLIRNRPEISTMIPKRDHNIRENELKLDDDSSSLCSSESVSSSNHSVFEDFLTSNIGKEEYEAEVKRLNKKLQKLHRLDDIESSFGYSIYRFFTNLGSYFQQKHALGDEAHQFQADTSKELDAGSDPHLQDVSRNLSKTFIRATATGAIDADDDSDSSDNADDESMSSISSDDSDVRLIVEPIMKAPAITPQSCYLAMKWLLCEGMLGGLAWCMQHISLLMRFLLPWRWIRSIWTTFDRVAFTVVNSDIKAKAEENRLSEHHQSN